MSKTQRKSDKWRENYIWVRNKWEENMLPGSRNILIVKCTLKTNYIYYKCAWRY